MQSLEAVTILEGDTRQHLDDLIAMQTLINSGDAWKLQGTYGRAAMHAIEQGCALLGHVSRRDYYGSRVPSRDHVQPGTKGSYEYVLTHSGKDIADALAAAE